MQYLQQNGRVEYAGVPQSLRVTHGTQENQALDPIRAIRDLESILENVVRQLDNAEGTRVTITLEVETDAEAFNDRVRRTVSENATQLGFESYEFEE